METTDTESLITQLDRASFQLQKTLISQLIIPTANAIYEQDLLLGDDPQSLTGIVDDDDLLDKLDCLYDV